MIVFTWKDLERVILAKRNKLIRWSLCCAALFFFIRLSLPLHYEARATFKQSSIRMDQSLDVKNLFRAFSSGATEGSPSTLMLSDTVLEKVIGKLGLQAHLNSSWIHSLRANLCAELRIKQKEIPLPRFSDLTYLGEEPLSLTLRKLSETDYVISDSKKEVLAQGTLGEPLWTPDFQLTVNVLPSSITLVLKPLQEITASLRKTLSIKSTREDKNLFLMKCRDINRFRSADIVNTLSAMYETYLIEENQLMIGAQLAYLKKRQDELSGKLDQEIAAHAQVLKKNLKSEGTLGIKDEIEFLLEPLQKHQLHLDEVELELHQMNHRLSQIKVNPLLTQEKAAAIHKYNALLAEQISSVKTILHEVEQRKTVVSPPTLPHLAPLVQELNEIDRSTPLFHHKENVVKAALQDAFHHLTARQHAMEQNATWIKSIEHDLAGISLSSARQLFDHYSTQFDDLHAQLKQLVFLHGHLLEPHFEISTLSNLLSDPVTAQLVQKASDLEAQLCDDISRSSKDRDRLRSMLLIQKRFLESHLEQIIELGKIRIELLKEKLASIYATTQTLLLQKKEALTTKITELKHSMQTLPDLWIHENRLKFKTELTKGMMEGLVHIAETKNLSHHLYQVESRPLDKAKPPLLSLYPFLCLKTASLFALSLCIGAFLLFTHSLIRQAAPSLATLEQCGIHTSGLLSLQSSLAVTEERDLETLRHITDFLLKSPKGAISVIGKTQTSFFPALTTLLNKHRMTCCVVDCSLGKIASSQDAPGLLQAVAGAAPCFHRYPSFDFLPTGGSSQEGVELFKSTSFQTFLKELVQHYDYLFLLARTSLNSLEADALLSQSSAAIAIAESSLGSIQLFCRQKEKIPVTFIQYPVLIEP